MATRYSLVALGAVDQATLETARATLPTTLPEETFRWASEAEEPSLIATSQAREPMARLLEHLWNCGMRVMLVEGAAAHRTEKTPTVSPLTLDRQGHQAFRSANAGGEVRANPEAERRQRRLTLLLVVLGTLALIYVAQHLSR